MGGIVSHKYPETTRGKTRFGEGSYKKIQYKFNRKQRNAGARERKNAMDRPVFNDLI
jgi:hypothetical protein